MKFVVDSNILFNFFWKNSTFRKICERRELEFFSPEYALEEIKKYKEEITKKAKISEKEFNNIRLDLINRINFTPLESYVSEFNNIKKLAEKFGEKSNEILKDVDFIALALKLNMPLLTHDKLLKEQNEIQILTIKEFIEII